MFPRDDSDKLGLSIDEEFEILTDLEVRVEFCLELGVDEGLS